MRDILFFFISPFLRLRLLFLLLLLLLLRPHFSVLCFLGTWLFENGGFLFLFSGDADEGDSSTETVKRDLSSLSRAERVQLLMQTAPELAPLADELKQRWAEVTDELLPALEMLRKTYALVGGVILVLFFCFLYSVSETRSVTSLDVNACACILYLWMYVCVWISCLYLYPLQ